MRRASELLIVLFALTLAAPAPAEPRLKVERGARQLYLATDKPLYRPGETIWFRSWEFAVKGFAAAAGAHEVDFELVDPRGAVVAQRKVQAAGGLATNDITLPADLAGGRYLLRVRSGDTVEERSLLVASYEVPRLKKELQLLQTSYRPGEVVTAVVKVARATGEPVAGAKVDGLLWVDGRDVERVEVRADRRGAATLRLHLPSAVAKGDALLTAVVSDGGATESIQRRVPISRSTPRAASS
jgi:uncharacterized protein YfaS (alpha-2-macroglobulin family)